ncbi:MAG: amidohydrolase [Candidatus Eisenbacteria bacterium]
MPERIGFTGAAVYLGGGEVIEEGYVTVKGPIIEAVGPSCDLKKTPDFEVVDLAGGLMLAGLTDCHVHLVSYALGLIGLDLAGTTCLEEGLRMIERHLKHVPEGGWLSGRGWDKQRWGLSGFPTREMLDAISGDHPVALTSRDGHLMWVNSVVLAKLGLDGKAFHIDGGEIETDENGRPTGILKENAAGLVESRAGGEEKKRATAAIEAASRKLVGLGLTCVHTIEDERDAEVTDLARERGFVGLDLVRLREIKTVEDVERLSPSPRAAFVKIYADGALGSQTACMLKSYSCGPDNTGISVTSKGDLTDLVTLCVEKGLSVAVHAIGDKANRDVLDVYEAVRKALPAGDTILRVEHAQILRSEDIARFGRLGVIASMQPVHIVADMRVAEAYWGARCRNAYAWKSILLAGGTLAFGSDAPIEDPDPLKGIHAAVTRRNPDEPGSPSWYGDERLTVAEAIDCYTRGAAAAGGEGVGSGRIEAGARANLTVLDKDILASEDPDTILDTSVEMTVIGGKVYASR